MKLRGNLTVSFTIRLTLLLLELFCIPIVNKTNKEKLYVIVNNIFLKLISTLKK